MRNRLCRIDNSSIVDAKPNESATVVGNHPLAVVKYACGHTEFVRHDELFNDA